MIEPDSMADTCALCSCEAALHLCAGLRLERATVEHGSCAAVAPEHHACEHAAYESCAARDTSAEFLDVMAAACRCMDLAMLAGAPHELLQPLLAAAEPWAARLKQRLAGAPMHLHVQRCIQVTSCTLAP